MLWSEAFFLLATMGLSVFAILKIPYLREREEKEGESMTRVAVVSRHTSLKRAFTDLDVGDFFYKENAHVCLKVTSVRYFDFEKQSSYYLNVEEEGDDNIIVYPIERVSLHVDQMNKPPSCDGIWCRKD